MPRYLEENGGLPRIRDARLTELVRGGTALLEVLPFCPVCWLIHVSLLPLRHSAFAAKRGLVCLIWCQVSHGGQQGSLCKARGGEGRSAIKVAAADRKGMHSIQRRSFYRIHLTLYSICCKRWIHSCNCVLPSDEIRPLFHLGFASHLPGP